MLSRPLLIVDDGPENLAALRQVLAQDYKLVFARSGTEALASVRKHHPALILLDVQMPDMDGFSVCRELKNDPQTASIPVIFITALAETGHEATGFACGAVDYISKPIAPAIVKARVRTHLSLVQASRLEESYRDAIFMLGVAGHYNDNDTGVHIWRMAAYSAVLAKGCGWTEDDCSLIELAAPMHDTGKLAIPDAILRKPGKLDDDEWAVMKTHAQIGHDILARSNAPVFQLAAEIALRHHEKWDGGGYPGGLAGGEIPESARIVAVADVFDALTMRRPYKEPWPLERVMKTIRESAGTHFEPRIVEVFESQLPNILRIKDEWAKREEDGEFRYHRPHECGCAPECADAAIATHWYPRVQPMSAGQSPRGYV